MDFNKYSLFLSPLHIQTYTFSVSLLYYKRELNSQEKNIKLLSDVDLKLYYKLLSHAKLINMDIKKYLAFLGFNYLVQKEEVTRESIKSELTSIYKNKKITKLSVNQPQLYNKIYKFS